MSTNVERQARARPGLAAAAGLALLGCTVAGLVLLACFKGLNFDEALALRSGWLALEHADATPVLWSPWTLLLGAIAHGFDDPAIVLRLARLLALSGLLCGVWASLRGRGAACGTLALLLACCCDPVIAHLIEFRYDASLIGAALLYQALLQRERPLGWPSGLLLGWLMIHQLKGLALGALLLLFSALAHPGRLAWRPLLLGLLGVVLGWAALSGLAGQAARWQDGYLLFLELSRVAPEQPRDEHLQLWPVLALAAAALALCGWRLRQRQERALACVRQQLSEHAGWLAFGALALLHPRLFPYHLAPIALLASVGAGRQLGLLWPGRVLALAATVPLVMAASAQLGFEGSVASLERVVAVPLDTPIATLRALKAAAHPDDRVLDPSGVVYFLPACSREWYVDVLFETWVKQGRWMYSPVSPPCTWSLNTHRLKMVPSPYLARLEPFRLHPGTGGLLSAEPAGRRIEPLGLGDRTTSSW